MIKEVISKMHKHGFKENEIYSAYKIFFGTLVSEPRLKIINLLRKGGRSVSEIISELKMNQTSVSHNLTRLKKCGFVGVKTRGKFRYYSLNKKTIKPLMSLINNHMNEYCIHILKKNKGGKR